MSGQGWQATAAPLRLGLSDNSTAGEGGQETAGHQWMFLALLLVIFISVAGNVLVCLAVVTERSLHSATNYFLLSMAMADLMVALLVMPLGLIKYIYGMWVLGPAMCNIWVSLDILCCTSSIMHICTISMDRYLAICSPFTIQRRSRFQTPTKIAIVWTISTLLCSPIFVLGFVSAAHVLDVHACVLTNRLFRIYGSIVAFYIPLFIVAVSYGRTARTLSKKARAFAEPKTANAASAPKKHPLLKKTSSPTDPGNDSSSADSNARLSLETAMPAADLKAAPGSPRGSLRLPPHGHMEMRRLTSGTLRKGGFTKINTERRASKVLGIVFVAFLVGWMPFFVANFLSAVWPSCAVPATLFAIFEWLGWASSMVNPFIYTVFNKTFQRTFWRLLTFQRSLAGKHPRSINASV